MGIIPTVLVRLIDVVEILIIVECFMSWIIRDNQNEILNSLRTITNPILEPFRKLQDNFLPNSMGIDFSPLIALILLQILTKVIYIIL